MSIPGKSAPAKLIIGVLMEDRSLLKSLAAVLSGRFGPIDLVSQWLPFDYTDYYEPEMGGPLSRRMLGFSRLVAQEELADIKLFTNELETAYMKEGLRRVNIDPGYLLRERFVLATGKNFTHRIYIGKGIYADLTLTYARGGFQSLPWTYPDYADTPITTWLMYARDRLVHSMRHFR